VALRPEAWQQLADAYGPAGRRVEEYAAPLGAARHRHSVRTLDAVADRIEAILDGT